MSYRVAGIVCVPLVLIVCGIISSRRERTKIVKTSKDSILNAQDHHGRYTEGITETDKTDHDNIMNAKNVVVDAQGHGLLNQQLVGRTITGKIDVLFDMLKKAATTKGVSSWWNYGQAMEKLHHDETGIAETWQANNDPGQPGGCLRNDDGPWQWLVGYVNAPKAIDIGRGAIYYLEWKLAYTWVWFVFGASSGKNELAWELENSAQLALVLTITRIMTLSKFQPKHPSQVLPVTSCVKPELSKLGVSTPEVLEAGLQSALDNPTPDIEKLKTLTRGRQWPEFYRNVAEVEDPFSVGTNIYYVRLMRYLTALYIDKKFGPL